MLNAPHRRRGSRLKDEAQTGQGEEKMTVSRKLTSIITAAAIAATSLGTLTTSAYAGGGYRNGGHGHYDDRGYRGGRDRYYAVATRRGTTRANTSPSVPLPSCSASSLRRLRAVSHQRHPASDAGGSLASGDRILRPRPFETKAYCLPRYLLTATPVYDCAPPPSRQSGPDLPPRSGPFLCLLKRYILR